MPEYGADAGVLVKQVDTETAAFFSDIGEVEILAFVEAVFLRVAQDFHDVAFELGIAQLPEFDWHQVAIHTQHRRDSDREMNVGTTLCEAELQK
jgi:hypothetical protein